MHVDKEDITKHQKPHKTRQPYQTKKPKEEKLDKVELSQPRRKIMYNTHKNIRAPPRDTTTTTTPITKRIVESITVMI
jgi:hypothetical protein